MSLKESPAWPFLYVVACVACLGVVIYRACRGHGQVLRKNIISALLPLVPLGALCLCVLPAVGGLVVFCGACLLWARWMPLHGKLLPAQGKAVLLTGCDTGFGYAFAKHLDELGFKVFAGVLNKNGPGPLELSRVCSSRLSLLQLNVTSTEEVNNAYAEVQSSLQDTGLWGIINNAGVLGIFGQGELLPLSVHKNCMEVNYFGTVRVSKTFLPLLRKAKGRLISISSMAGVSPLHGAAAYGASKAAMAMFSAVMSQELAKWGIKVVTFYPGGFKTNILGTKERWEEQDEIILQDVGADVKDTYGEDYIRTMKDIYLEMMKTSSSDLSPILRDMDHALLSLKPKLHYTPGSFAYIIPFIYHHLPPWMFNALASKFFDFKMLPKALRNQHNQDKKNQ